LLSRKEKEALFLLKLEQKIRLARKDFWEFCKLLHPDFYKESRPHLKEYCYLLQAFYYRELKDKNGDVCTRLAISLPPQHGKSRTLFLFECWVFGHDPGNMVLTLSYSDDMAIKFSRYVRDTIGQEKLNPLNVVYSDIFPETRLKAGDASVQSWALDGRHFSYKGAGILSGGFTGLSAKMIVIDDPIKGSYEAFNKTHKQSIIEAYTGTVLQRRNPGCLEIINMTRWAADDLIGHVLSSEYKDTWYVYEKSIQDIEGNMLCDELLSEADYLYLASSLDQVILNANYWNKLIDESFLMYPEFKRFNKYEKQKFERTICATDTADTGKDFLSAPVAKVLKGQLYIFDWLYTQEDTETTPFKYAEMLVNNNVEFARIESNGGGNIFANFVKEILWKDYSTREIDIKTFPQTKNKEARIRDFSFWIMNNVFFPEDFNITHPQVWRALTTFLRVGKNINDDAPDSLTMLAEMVRNIDRDWDIYG
jgi:predicted phage terminase large subunit-like protein